MSESLYFLDGVNTRFNTDQLHDIILTTGKTDLPLLAKVQPKARGTVKDDIRYSVKDFSEIKVQQRNNLPGQDAPSGKVFRTKTETNTLEIIHEALEIDYSQSTNDPKEQNSAANLAFQREGLYDFVAKNMSHSLYFGKEVVALDDQTAPKTMGLEQFITTKGGHNVPVGTIDTPQALTKDHVLHGLKQIFKSGNKGKEIVAVMNADVKEQWDFIFQGDRDLQDPTESSLYVDAIRTNYGRVGTMIDLTLEGYNGIFLLSVDQIAPVFKQIVTYNDVLKTELSGHVFIEPLAKTGSKQKWQLYGEYGWMMGIASSHALLSNIQVSNL